MFKKVLLVMVAFAFAISLAGCATARKKKTEELDSCKNQVSMLESQLQNRDEEIASLRDQLSKVPEKTIETSNISKKRVVPEIKSRPNVKQIQTALDNAGYKPGSIDGKMGKTTVEAIKAFQRDNKIHVDGKVGKKTWSLLRTYLYQKVK
ncbi:MAG: peptidoglycan-binding domain-containing protein [Candidatus Omnitrophica bacterium]|nr:peptidoglycan-binding domain-containing protein [Candidatus Omnitrophota bacterium]